MMRQYEQEVLELAKEKTSDKEDNDFTENRLKMAVFQVIKHHIRDRILKESLRIDNRDLLTVRPLHCEV